MQWLFFSSSLWTYFSQVAMLMLWGRRKSSFVNIQPWNVKWYKNVHFVYHFEIMYGPLSLYGKACLPSVQKVWWSFYFFISRFRLKPVAASLIPPFLWSSSVSMSCGFYFRNCSGSLSFGILSKWFIHFCV